MKEAVETVGFVLTLMGISGTIDHLAVQPVMGLVLNVFNRVVFPRIDALQGYELYANLSVAALGVAVIALGSRLQPP